MTNTAHQQLLHAPVTAHAAIRANQRGIRQVTLRHLWLHADLAVDLGRHLCARRLSRAALAEALGEGLSRHEADRMIGLALVESADGAIVTVAPLRGRKGRHYARGRRRLEGRSRI